MQTDGIVLLAKRKGITSFSALNSVKKALRTTRVGHTGTLDSFAQGLLVVCCGRLTRLAGHITDFNKEYRAVIKFGEETDTLEYSGKVIRRSPLPTLDALRKAIASFTGEGLQAPPAFSAIHVDGKRASDLARQGISVEIPKRKIMVFGAELLDYELSDDGFVSCALISFSVSKGTYIRCLARDIAAECGSCAHLIGLLRTKVGNFRLEDAAGISFLEDFSIKSARADADSFKRAGTEGSGQTCAQNKNPNPDEPLLQEEIRKKIRGFTEESSLLCGFRNLHLRDEKALLDFRNGKKLSRAYFSEDFQAVGKQLLAVFYEGRFSGLVEGDEKGRLHYRFVSA